MKKKLRVIISIIITLLIFSCFGFWLLTDHIFRLKTEIEALNLKIQLEYDTLTKITSSITLEILNLSQPESVKAVIQSLYRPLAKYDAQFSKAIKSGDYDSAIYLMNKKVEKFFEIINYSWEYVPSLKSDTLLISNISQISSSEEKIDSLITLVRKKRLKLSMLSTFNFFNHFRKEKGKQ